MKENRSLQPRIPFRQKIILVLFGLSLFFVLLEVGLRLGGFILLSIQEHRNLQSIKQKGTYRILCLGESTTQGQYPQFLEEVLNQRNIGVRFSIVDKGGGTNTEAILKQVESCLDEYHPDMVVAMMGINDGGAHMPYEQPSLSMTIRFLRSFKIYKLSRLLWLHMATKAKEIGLYKLHRDKQPAQERQSNLFNIRLEEGHTQQEDNIKNEDALKKTLELNPRNDWAYLELGQLYEGQGRSQQAEECFKKALELNPNNDWVYIGLGRLYYNTGQIQQAEECFKKALEANPRNDLAYKSLTQGMGITQSTQEYYKKTDELRLTGYNPITTYNYHKLKGALDRRGVKLVCVQYPMRSIQPLKKIFEGNIEGIVFVDNEKTFKEAVKEVGYRMYFKDIFGGDFGHCTDKGNRLLAENITNVILKEVFKK
jgi:hypothetical protein